MREVNMYNRRTVLHALGIGTASTLAGCSSDGGSGGTTETPTKQGGTLRIADTVTITSLNALTADAKSEWIVTQNMYSFLTQMNSDLTVSPELATDWSSNEDNTEWTFNLRDDVTFHHSGETVTAHDVAATANEIHAEDSPALAKGNVGPFDTAEVVDDTTVKFKFTRSDGLIPRRWARNGTAIYPKDKVEGDWDELADRNYGSGPFKLEEYNGSGVTILKAVDDYFQTDENGNQLPYLDKFEVEILPDPQTMVTSLQNGEVDVLYKIPRSQYSRAKNIDGVTTKRTEAAAYPVIQMRVTEKPFDSKKVRNAFKYAIDRESIMKGAISGLGTLANDHPIGPSYPTHTDLEDRSQDLDKAKNLLQEAGYGEGGEEINLTIKPPSSPQYVLDTTVLATEQFNQLPNVNIEVKQQSYDTWIEETWTKGTFYTSFYTQRPTADTILNLTWHSEGAWQEAAWDNQEFDTWAEKAASAANEEDRREAIKECQKIIKDEGPSIIPFYSDALSAHQNDVKGFTPYPTQKWVRGDQIRIDEGSQ